MRSLVIISAMILLLFFTMFLNGCSTKPPDSLICVEMSLSRGECIRIISGEKITIDETHKYKDKTYWDMRPSNLILPLESWVDIKQFIIKLCKKNSGMCDKEVSSWETSIGNVDGALKEKQKDPWEI